ncbi:MAG: putative bifunctional diguanylate cyclase/phosphodiesterase [Kineosporiaceae bacterium]
MTTMRETTSAAPGGAPEARSLSWRRVAMGLAVATPLAFMVSTVPGVRHEAGYNLLLDGLLNNVAYEAAALVCLLRVLCMPDRNRSSYLLPAALAIYGGGNVFWTIVVRPMDPQPFPSGADALFLAFYPIVFVSLMQAIRRNVERLPATLWLDGLVGGLAVGAVISAVSIRSILSAGTGTWAAVATTAAYPLLDLVLLLMVTIVLSLHRWRPPIGIWLLTAGLLFFVVADVEYLFATANGTYFSGGPIDGVWVFAVVLMALAPGWGSRPSGLSLPTWALLAFPVVSTGTALTLLVVGQGQNLHPVTVVLATATVVVALARLVSTFREVVSLAGSRQLALTDELTGLGNRRALYDVVPGAVATLEPTASVALLLLDLDRFKEVNDSLGHHAGDEMLQQVGNRLRAFVPDRADLVVRLGGDEFALVLATHGTHALAVSEEVRQVVGEPMMVDGVTVHIDVSIGVAVLPAGAAELSTLLRQADVAMYHAKTQRLGTFSYTVEEDEFASGDRLATIELLRTAIAQRQMVLHYQPKVDRETGHSSSVEALVRWQHPEQGLLFPDAFLPLVEHAGLMQDLTAAVLEQALDQAAVWHADGRNLAVAVNISAASLNDLELPDRVAVQLAERQLPGRALEIEITEDFLMGDRSRAQKILTGLRELGVRIAVDDYGTGYSSLAYLRELPVDELKLDRSFVSGLQTDERALAIVRSTIGLAHSLGMRMVAEGVEDADTSSELVEAGCDVQQGWYYAKALPPRDLEQWLDRHRATVEAAVDAPGGALPAQRRPANGARRTVSR